MTSYRGTLWAWVDSNAHIIRDADNTPMIFDDEDDARRYSDWMASWTDGDARLIQIKATEVQRVSE